MSKIAMAKKDELRQQEEGEIIQPNLPVKVLRKPAFLVAVLTLFIWLLVVFSNHFQNPFQFDDSHTIVNNTAIRNLKNIPSFFTDSTSSSTLPANRAYRPGLTTLNSIDYAVQHKMTAWAKKDTNGIAASFERKFCPDWAKLRQDTKDTTINPFYFHISIFASYVLLGFLLFFFVLHIFRKVFPDLNYQHWAALVATGFFLLHTANAETINYIISRDDSFSTMMVLLAFDLYFYFKITRKYLLFLIPIVLGYFVKEPTVMFAPLLLVYIWLFGDVDKNKVKVYLQIGLSFFIAGILYLLTRKMTPAHHTYGGGDWLNYIFTQTFVIVHYFNSFLLPTNLSADTDWTLVNSFFDDRVIAGLIIIIGLLGVAWKCSKQQSTKPIAFGILWFFIALAPTSIFPLSEVLNDHRPFFAYIGLVIAFVAAVIHFAESSNFKQRLIFPTFFFFLSIIFLFYIQGHSDHVGRFLALMILGILVIVFRILIYSPEVRKFLGNNFEKSGNDKGVFSSKIILIGVAILLLTSHSIGTHERNKIWNKGESLWKDVTEKSPGNGRGWMNYGLALMARNSMDSAIISLNKALSIYPNYSYANINMGIAQSKDDHDKEAEPYYIKAVTVDPYNPECYYFYSLFLLKLNRITEATEFVNKGLAISPTHEGLNLLKSSMQVGNFQSKLELARDLVKTNPTADNYVNLSLELYNANLFEESAHAGEEAVKLKPDYAIAYSNICAAYNKIGEYEKAEAAGKKATALAPMDQLVIGNYRSATEGLVKFGKLEAEAKKNPTYNNWVNLSLEYYNAGNFRKSMIAAEEATLINPNDVVGWNNVCAAANKIGEWDRAIIAGEKAVKLNPGFVQAQNNLAVAKEGKKNSGK